MLLLMAGAFSCVSSGHDLPRTLRDPSPSVVSKRRNERSIHAMSALRCLRHLCRNHTPNLVISNSMLTNSSTVH